MNKADAHAREILRNTSNLCLRKLHEQCTADRCQCDCHHRAAATAVTTYRCDACDEEFWTPQALGSHRRYKHSAPPRAELRAVASDDITPAAPAATTVPVTDDDDQAREAGIVWAEPPQRWAPKRKPLLTPEQETLLRANPGRSAQTHTFPSPAAASSFRKRWSDAPGEHSPDDWDVVARRFADGTSAIYVRYVGAAPCD